MLKAEGKRREYNEAGACTEELHEVVTREKPGRRKLGGTGLAGHVDGSIAETEAKTRPTVGRRGLEQTSTIVLQWPPELERIEPGLQYCSIATPDEGGGYVGHPIK